MVIKIPLDGGLVTQVDPDEVGANACTVLTNAELDKSGILYKRNGLDGGVNIHPSYFNKNDVFTNNHVHLKSITRFYSPKIDSKYVWVAIYVNNYGTADGDCYFSFFYSTDGESWTAINTLESSAEGYKSSDILLNFVDFAKDNYRADIKVFNNQLRIVLGTTNDARLWQYINRGYFWGCYPGHAGYLAGGSGENSYKGFFLDKTVPRDILAPNMSFKLSSSKFDEDGLWFYKTDPTGYDLSTTKYFYKYSLVFDGSQESPLTKNPIAEIGGTGVADKVIPTFDFEILPGSFENMENINRRLTSINIYRSTSHDGIYSKIESISTLKDDPNTIKVRASQNEVSYGKVDLRLSNKLEKDELKDKWFLDYNKNVYTQKVKSNEVNGLATFYGPWYGSSSNDTFNTSTGESNPSAGSPTSTDSPGTNLTPFGSGVGTEVTSSHWAQWGSEVSYRSNDRKVTGTVIEEINNIFRAYLVDSIVQGTGALNVNLGMHRSILMQDYVLAESGGYHGAEIIEQTSGTGMLNDKYLSYGPSSLKGSGVIANDDIDYWFPTTQVSWYPPTSTTTDGGIGSRLTFKTEVLSLEAETDYIFIGWVLSPDDITDLGQILQIQAKDPLGNDVPDYPHMIGCNREIVDGETAYPGVGYQGVRWQHFCMPFTTNSAGNYYFEFQFWGKAKTSATNITKHFGWSGLCVGKQLETKPQGLAYYDNDFWIGDLDLGSYNSRKGDVYVASTFSDFLWERHSEYGYIKGNTSNIIRPYKSIGDDPAFPVGQFYAETNEADIFINRNYFYINKQNDGIYPQMNDLLKMVHLKFFDKDLSDGTTHPTDSTTLDVKYKYSKFMNGRNYVANVKITKGENSEEHENWIMFSELNQPDVIPVTNYIQLKDAQGGAVVGVESLLGDLVVFMEKGIYRLSIPSVDPTAWSLSESEENIGCLSPESITKWEAGIFFAGKDHLYFLDANFQAQPMTKAIKDLYQGFTSTSVVAYDNIKTIYDPKKNKLFMYNCGASKKAYTLDLSVFPEERWVYHYPNPDPTTAKTRFMTIDEDLKVYHIENFSAQDKRRMRTEDGTSTEETEIVRQTGWISGPDLGKRIHVRRLNMKYNSGSDITVSFYVDGDDSTVVRSLTIPADTGGQDWYRCAPGVRGRQFMIRLETESSIDSVEVRRLEVEFE